MSDLLREGIFFFKAGRYFDAHEVWEELWRGTSPGSQRLIYQGLIQGSVGMHHLSRGNLVGARAQLRKALSKLGPDLPGGLPNEAAEVLEEMRKALESMDIPEDRSPGLH